MTMKRTPPLLTVLILSLLVGRAVSAGKAQTIQIGILQIPVASLELVESNSIPESATFYLLKDALELGGGSAVPCPTDPYPQYPTYSIVGLSGIYLVDNTGISGESIQEIMSPLEITPDPNAPAPEIDWPLSLSSLALVDPASVPDFGTFFLYTDQTNDDMPPPYPWNPCSTCPVYSLGITNLFLVDDSGWIRPQGDWTPNYTAPVYGTNLALYIIGVSDYTALLVLTNTVPGPQLGLRWNGVRAFEPGLDADRRAGGHSWQRVFPGARGSARRQFVVGSASGRPESRLVEPDSPQHAGGPALRRAGGVRLVEPDILMELGDQRYRGRWKLNDGAIADGRPGQFVCLRTLCGGHPRHWHSGLVVVPICGLHRRPVCSRSFRRRLNFSSGLHQWLHPRNLLHTAAATQCDR
jgi:hypothetical protein